MLNTRPLPQAVLTKCHPCISVAVVYSNYAYELETGGQRMNKAGRVTEIFVLRNGQWVNPGWHMDSGKSDK